MKKETLIAIGVLAALSIGLLVLMQSGDKSPEPIAYTIPKLDKADKIEITQDGKTTVLAKKDGAWRLQAPIDYPVASSAAEKLDKLLSRPIGMDMDYDASAASKYELGDSAASVAIYVGADKKASFRVGKEITVQPTNVKRAFISPKGQDRVFRAQAGLRTELLKALDDWREKKLVDFEEKDVTGVTIRTADGTEVVLAKADGEEGAWSLTKPEGVRLDETVAKRLPGAAARLRAAGFADDASAEQTGLDTPSHSLIFTLVGDKKPVTIHFGNPLKEDKGAGGGSTSPDVYMKVGDEKWVYTVKNWTWSQLAKGLPELRDKQMLKLDTKEIASLTFAKPEGDPLVVESTAEGWKLTKPEAKDVPEANVNAITRIIGDLKASSVPDTDPAKAGLADPTKATRVTVTLKDGSTKTILLGDAAAEGKKDLFARVDDGMVFVLASFNATKLTPTAESLTKEPAAAPPGGMPPGMPGGMPGGLPPGMMPGGLPPGVKIQ